MTTHLQDVMAQLEAAIEAGEGDSMALPIRIDLRPHSEYYQPTLITSRAEAAIALDFLDYIAGARGAAAA